ncbi:MAG: UDP-N-acetylmuramate dehydrogenase [Erysipelotrichaceae bacterium]|nr:UDP-N-acetylmuramate dehydrogenase [Erysipelotrichaceae bacterium]MBQ1512164.1 UDP-N-acetylmuramate dehydrogenase [Erysipelotrichaceae bacterium]MBQ1810278.1 UDP-N-acetylmuramate dehydrogenase [Erysipelotrichaceae bacterium]MBQ5755657.1 UDP-N-acetylmuramate dehydrogenase [Erysipelotrichaceae bacterium]
MNIETANFLSTHGDLRVDAYFKEITTIRIGGKIDYLVSPYDIDRLLLILRYLREKDIPFKIVGKGSNLLCGEADYEGCVIRLDHINDYTFDKDSVTVGAGASVVRFSRLLALQGRSGFEFASGIPGTIGGLVYMNAGAYKSSASEIVKRVLVLDEERQFWMDRSELEFAYRSSVFQKHPEWIILGAEFTTREGDRDEILKLMADRLKRRQETQPLDKPSAGSCFRNPEGDFAWRLIDGIGMRGFQRNGIKVSEKHPNFILNMGSGTANDFLITSNLIQSKVKEIYGVDLRREVECFNC